VHSFGKDAEGKMQLTGYIAEEGAKISIRGGQLVVMAQRRFNLKADLF